MSLFQRLQHAIGLTDDYIDSGYEEMPLEDDDNPFSYQDLQSPNTAIATPGLGNRPGLGWGQDEMMLMTPRSFGEIPQAVMALRQRKSVILNLSLLEPDQAQRCADYVAGGVNAIDGHQERLGESFFLFTPSSVKISIYSVMASQDSSAQATPPSTMIPPYQPSGIVPKLTD